MSNRIKITTNFYLDEYIDPRTYFNTKANGFMLMDEDIFILTQKLRDYYDKPISINNWWNYYDKNRHILSVEQIIKDIEDLNSKGRLHIWSGLRTPQCKIGAKGSAHRFGKAADPKGDEKVFFKIIEDNAKEFYNEGLRRVEDISITRGWLHIDTMEKNTKPDSIRVIDKVKSTKTITWI